MTHQEIFNTVAAHLLSMNAKALDNGACVYRAPEGRKCAAGILIMDEFYTRAMEGGSVTGTSPSAYLVRSALRVSGVPQEAFELVADLQRVHDNHDLCSWRKELLAVAKRWELKMENS